MTLMNARGSRSRSPTAERAIATFIVDNERWIP
jgi:hypothetical protein